MIAALALALCPLARAADRGSIELAAPAAAGEAAALRVLDTPMEDVARPAGTADLALSLGAAFQDGSFPSAYAVELSPFWLSRAAGRLTFTEHLRAGAPTLLRNLNLSMATLRDDSGATTAALALRSTFWPRPGAGSEAGRLLAGLDGQPLEGEAGACEASLRAMAARARAAGEALDAVGEEEIRQQARQAFLDLVELCEAVDPALEPAEARACREARQEVGLAPGPVGEAGRIARAARARDEAAAKVEALANAAVTARLSELPGAEDLSGCARLAALRRGFVLDLALGGRLGAPDTRLSGLRPQGLSAWLTPGLIGARHSLFGILRYRLDGLDAEPAQTVLGGLGGGWLGERHALSLSLAAWAGSQGPGGSLSPTVDLRLGRGVWLRTGLRAALPADEPGSLLSFGNLRLGTAAERSLGLPGSDELAALD